MKWAYVNEIENVSDSLEAQLTEFSDLFTNKVGEIKGINAELHLEKNVTPKFCKAGTLTSFWREKLFQYFYGRKICFI